MNKKLLNILAAIKLFQQQKEELRQINDEKGKLETESEYSQKFVELSKAFAGESILFTSLSELNNANTFDELLQIIETEVQKKLNTQESYDENEIKEYYDNELSEEEKKQYDSYENFRKTILEEWQKHENARKEKLENLLNEFKNLGKPYEDMKRKQQELDARRVDLLNERWSLLENDLKNINVKLLENGIEYQNGLPVLKEDMDVVTTVPGLDADNLSLDDLVMVHATRYFPENGIIKTHRDATGARRNTIHTALNGRVTSHMYGNWDNCGIIILDPLKEHIDQVECVYSVDTFAYGSMKLSNESIILINKDQYNKFYEQNKEYIDNNKDRIMLFSGDSLIIVDKVLSMLGYAPQKANEWAWSNKYNSDMLDKFVHENYPDKLNAAHSMTPYNTAEKVEARGSILESFGMKNDGNDKIISLDVLYALREYNKDKTTKQFIEDAGVFVKDDEIHLLGIKDHINLLKSNNISEFQIERIDLLIKKYQMMNNLQTEDTETRHR